MKEFLGKLGVSAALAAAGAYFRVLLVPLIVLLCVMSADYLSGMIAAYLGQRLSSRIGITGIFKKAGYLFAVGVGMAVDYLSSASLSGLVGIDTGGGVHFFGMLVTVWLIINELLSILENLGEIGVPLPAFLSGALLRLRDRVAPDEPLTATDGRRAADDPN